MEAGERVWCSQAFISARPPANLSLARRKSSYSAYDEELFVSY